MGHVTWPGLGFSGSAAAEAAREAAEDLGASPEVYARLAGASFLGPSAPGNPRDRTLLFLQASTPDKLRRLDGIEGCLIILPAGTDPGNLGRGNFVFYARNPKYAYARVLNAVVPLSVQRGALVEGNGGPGGGDLLRYEGVVLEPGVTLGPDSAIGRGTYVMAGAVIGPRVRIGTDCVIGEGAVIGSPGFGFAFDGDRPPLRIPQLGGTLLGDRVEIGTLSCVDAGTIEPTLVEDDVKTNSHVHIAHNCRIGRGSVLGAAVSVSGSTFVGSRCWLGPGAVVRNKVTLGDGVTVGMGAVVVRDTGDGETVVGVPAKPTGNRVPWYESERGVP